MKKIMFSDRFGLTDAVLQGRKTMTRRIARFDETERPCQKGRDKCLYCQHYDRENGCTWLLDYSPYKVGEVVAVAQSYKSIHEDMMNGDYGNSRYDAFRCAMVAGTKGWNNKMFVRADLMPHHIRITDIKVERLQDISEEDVYREGFRHEFVNNGWGNAAYHEEAILVYYDNIGRTKQIRDKDPKEAFSFLIDKVSGSGTWERNPWVLAYTFELVK